MLKQFHNCKSDYRGENAKKAPNFCEPYLSYGEQKFGAFDKVIFRESGLPGEVGERAVGLSHLVRIFLLLHCISFFLSCKLEFSG